MIITAKKALVIMCCALLAIVSCLPAFASANDAKTVRIGYVNVKGYEEGGDGEYKTGFGYEYFQRIAYHTGWRYEYVYGSFGELFEKLEKGEVDVLGNVTYTPERAEKVLFAEYPQGNESFYIMVPPVRRELIDATPAQLEGKRIGVGRGTYQLELLKNYLGEHNITASVIELNGTADVLRAMDAGEIDAAAMTDAADYGFVPAQLLGFHDYYFAVSASRPDLLRELNAATRAILRADPNFNSDIARRYSFGTLQNGYLTTAEYEWLEGHGNTVRLGYLINNMPYSGEDEEGNIQGVITAVIDRLETVFGISVETRRFESLEIMGDAMFAHEIDCYGPAFGDFYITEQFNMIQTEPIITTTPALLYSGTLNTNRIAVTENSIFCQHVVGVLYPEAELVMCDTTEDCMNTVTRGDAGCMVATSGELNVLNKYKVMEKLSYAELFRNAEMCLFTNMGDIELATILNKAIILSGNQLLGATFVTGANDGSRLTIREFLTENLGYVLAALLILVFSLFMLLRSAQRSERKARAAQNEIADINRELQERVNMTRSLAGLFFTTYYIDLKNDTFTEVTTEDDIRALIGVSGKATDAFEAMCRQFITPEYDDAVRRFLDLTTLDERMRGKRSISMEYVGKKTGWSRMLMVEAERDAEGHLTHVIIATRMIHDEKAMRDARDRAMRDASDAEAKAKAIARRAERDALTGVLNRFGYERVVNNLRDSNIPIALLLMDVDRFKAVNDQFGHEAGDDALRKVSAVLKVHFREMDHIIRYGGDEFMVIMTGVSRMHTDVIRDKIETINRELKESSTANGPCLSVSVGIAFSDKGMNNSLFQTADEALYKTKEKGRSGYTFAE